MNRLCGWIGPPSLEDPPDSVLEEMAGGLAPGGAAHRGQAEADIGLAVTGPGAGQSGHFDGTVWAVVAGRPDWGGNELAALAEGQGQATAAVEAYRRHGKDAVKHVTGPFSLAIVDRAARRALVAIDRFATHTLCYTAAPGGLLVFGSTADAVRHHPAGGSTISPQEIFDYLFCYACPAPRTIYAEQKKLLPAQRLWFDQGAVETDFYWRPPYGEPDRAGFDELGLRLKDCLAEALGRVLAQEGGAAVGAFLSGGLDSSTVTALLKKLGGERPRTFTVTFDDPRFDESDFATTAARHFGTDHKEYRLTPRDVLDLVPRVAETYDEPLGNSSVVPAYYCARLAKDNGIDVLLAGDGGDELFAGNSIYADQLTLDLYNKIPRALRSFLIEPLVSALPGIGLFRKARNYVSYARMPVPDRLHLFNFWRLTDKAEIFEPGIVGDIDQEEPLRIRRAIYDGARSNSTLQCMMHLDMTAALADSDLRKVNRMCELAGLRVRYPFLDEDVAEFAARVPPELMMPRGKLRDFYKRAVEDLLPRKTIDKSKHGFGMPFEQWLKQDPGLRAMAQDSLRDFRRRGYLTSAFLDQVAQGHAGPEPAPTDEIVWDIMILELWLQAHGHP